MNKESNKNYVTLTLRLNKRVVETIDQVVTEDGQTRTHFIRSAINRALKNWKPPLDNPNLWPPCHHCRERHDPKKAHGVEW